MPITSLATQTPKVDVGGGGTIGGFLSMRNMEVLDVGIPLLSMHSTYEMSSKVDYGRITASCLLSTQWNDFPDRATWPIRRRMQHPAPSSPRIGTKDIIGPMAASSKSMEQRNCHCA